MLCYVVQSSYAQIYIEYVVPYRAYEPPCCPLATLSSRDQYGTKQIEQTERA
jgi:hypothetical protein